MGLTQLGRYIITGTLGRGAMGVVYQAHDPLIERTVAIKTVSCAGLSRDEAEDFELRFNREAKSAGRLNHPNIVTIHDIGRSDDLSYIAMEFLVGRSLRDILDSGLVLPVDRIAAIAAQIADGLAFAHDNEVVHRDIKPANIMVLDSETVKITDFGVALLPSGSHTVAGTAYGSPKYMSPEQVTGQKADGRSDIFSLGAVLYEMLAGRPPFAGDDINAILYQVLNGAPPLPSTFNADLPHGFDRVVARAMAKNPDKRYQSAAEMAADLRKYRRVARQAQKKQNADGAPHLAVRPIPAGAGDVTEPVDISAVSAMAAAQRPEAHKAPETFPASTAGKTVAASRPRVLLLRYGPPLLALGLIAGWLLRPAAAPDLDSSPKNAEAVVARAELPAATAAAMPAEVLVRGDEAAVPPPVSSDPPVVAPIAPPVVAEGRIRLAVAPWGEVYVDSKKAGVSPPLTEIRLPAGKHRIEIRNGEFVPHRQSVDLAPDASFRIKHKFE